MITVHTPADVEAVVSRLQYLDPNPYKVSSAHQTLENGTAHCLEATLVAAFLMETLGFPPEFLSFSVRSTNAGASGGHSVYIYEDKEGIKSIGRSRYLQLEGRQQAFDSVDALAKSYGDGFLANGWLAVDWDIYELLYASFDWRASEEDLAAMFSRFFSKDDGLDMARRVP